MVVVGLKKNIKIPFIISDIVITLLAVLGFLSSDPVLRVLAIFFLILSILINLILCFIIDYINRKISIIVSASLFILAILMLWTIKVHYNELTSYEDWQYYNYQPIVSKSLDQFMGKNALVIQYFLCMLLLNLISNFTGIAINYFKKSDDYVLEERE